MTDKEIRKAGGHRFFMQVCRPCEQQWRRTDGWRERRSQDNEDNVYSELYFFYNKMNNNNGKNLIWLKTKNPNHSAGSDEIQVHL